MVGLPDLEISYSLGTEEGTFRAFQGLVSLVSSLEFRLTNRFFGGYREMVQFFSADSSLFAKRPRRRFIPPVLRLLGVRRLGEGKVVLIYERGAGGRWRRAWQGKLVLLREGGVWRIDGIYWGCWFCGGRGVLERDGVKRRCSRCGGRGVLEARGLDF